MDQFVKGLETQKGFVGLIIMDKNGVIIENSFGEEGNIPQHLFNIITFAKKELREAYKDDEFNLMRFRASSREVVASIYNDFFLFVVRNPTD